MSDLVSLYWPLGTASGIMHQYIALQGLCILSIYFWNNVGGYQCKTETLCEGFKHFKYISNGLMTNEGVTNFEL